MMKKRKIASSHTTVVEAFQIIMLHEFKVIKKWRKITLKTSDPEGVHQLRIALRRMRTALIVFKPLIASTYSKKLAKRLKQYTQALDHARDLDVFIASHINSSSPTNLSTTIMAEHSQAHKKVAKLLKSKAFNKQLRTDKKWLKSKKIIQTLFKHQSSMISLTLFVASRLTSLHEQIILRASNSRMLNDNALHKLRIDCKILRYTAEFFRSLYDKQAINTFIEQLKSLQDSLGDVHDAYIQKKQVDRLVDNKLIEDADAQPLYTATLALSETTKATVIAELTHFAGIPCPWIMSS